MTMTMFGNMDPSVKPFVSVIPYDPCGARTVYNPKTYTLSSNIYRDPLLHVIKLSFEIIDVSLFSIQKFSRNCIYL